MIDSTLCRNAKTMRFIFFPSTERKQNPVSAEKALNLSPAIRSDISRKGLAAAWLQASEMDTCCPTFLMLTPFWGTQQLYNPGAKCRQLFVCWYVTLQFQNTPQLHWYMLMIISNFIMAGQWWWSNASHYRAPSKTIGTQVYFPHMFYKCNHFFLFISSLLSVYFSHIHLLTLVFAIFFPP